MTIFVISVLTALSISFLCSLAEAALLSLTPSQVAEISTRHPRIGKIWQGFKANIQEPISVILTLNTAAHTVGAAVAGAMFAELFGIGWMWLFSLGFTFAMLQYTEILPKTLGVRFNRSVAARLAIPLTYGIVLLRPLIRFIHLLNRPFERNHRHGPAHTTLDEITSLAAMARMADQLGRHQERIIQGATRLTGRRAAEVMIPREQVTTLPATLSINEALSMAQVEAHTRFPVADPQDRTLITGYVNFKELVYLSRASPGETSFQKIIRPVRHVEPGTLATEVLKIFVDQHEHMAIVRDHSGKCQGLITLEDLVEELVGEIQDEFDRLPVHLQQLPDGTWLAGGGAPIGEIAARVGAALPADKASLADWLAGELGAPPRPGASVIREGVKVQVRRVRRGRVFEASVERAA